MTAPNPPADLITEAVEEYWGPKCHNFDPGCDTCKAWRSLEAAATALEEMLGLLERIQANGQLLDSLPFLAELDAVIAKVRGNA